MFDVLDYSIEIKKRFASYISGMNEHYQKICDTMLSNVPDALHRRLKHLLEYNCTGGKMYRGFIIYVLKNALSEKVSCEELLSDVFTLCWKCEILQAFALIEDDIMDDSETRRGKSSWWKVVGQANAINDGIILQQLSHKLAYNIRPGIAAKVALHSTDIQYLTAIGQRLDLEYESSDPSLFNHTLYEQIVFYKTSMYTFYEPFLYGILLADLNEEEEGKLIKQAKQVCELIGLYFQIQDDFLDCFGSKHEIGKDGTDIVCGKCTWLIVEAMRHASPKEVNFLVLHYGKKEYEQDIIQLYNKLELKQHYNDKIKHLTTTIKQTCETIDPRLASCVFDVLSMLLKRKN